MYKCYLTCPRGLESLAKKEVFPFASSISEAKGGINFESSLEGLYNVNINSRVGMHLLVELFTFEATITPASNFIFELEGHQKNSKIKILQP